MDADEQEQLLMFLNKARSPEMARELLEKYHARHASDVLKHLQKRKKVTFRMRLNRLLLKMAGHDERDPYRCDLVSRNRLD
jgi:predicted Zn-ribbon and HTH transcriptional regulator